MRRIGYVSVAATLIIAGLFTAFAVSGGVATTGTVTACATVPAQTISANSVPVGTVAESSGCATVTYTVSTETVTTTVPAATTAPATTTVPAPVPAAQFSGPFSCYGATPSCYTPDSCTGGIYTTSTTTAGALSSLISGAPAGTVICLNTATSFGSVSLTGAAKTADVVVQPAPGVKATVGSIRIVDGNHLRFTGLNTGSATVITSQNVTLSHNSPSDGSTYFICQARTSSNSCIWDPANQGGVAAVARTMTNMNILLDYNDFTYGVSTRGATLCDEGRVENCGNSASPTPSGITISHNRFQRGCMDGVGNDGDVNGVHIGPGNEFLNFSQDVCSASYHVDTIESNSWANIVIDGNYFHSNNGQACISTFSGADSIGGTPSTTFTNNVVELSAGAYAGHECVFQGTAGARVSHNTFILGAGTDLGRDNQGLDATNQVYNDNVFSGGGGVTFTTNGGSNACWCYAASYNLNGVANRTSGTNNITGTPVFVSSPASGYYHYQLDPSSPGYHAASDGKSMGISP